MGPGKPINGDYGTFYLDGEPIREVQEFEAQVEEPEEFKKVRRQTISGSGGEFSIKGEFMVPPPTKAEADVIEILKQEGLKVDNVDVILRQATIMQLCGYGSRLTVLNTLVGILRFYKHVEEAVNAAAEQFKELTKQINDQIVAQQPKPTRGRKGPKPWETNKRRFYDK